MSSFILFIRIPHLTPVLAPPSSSERGASETAGFSAEVRACSLFYCEHSSGVLPRLLSPPLSLSPLFVLPRRWPSSRARPPSRADSCSRLLSRPGRHAKSLVDPPAADRGRSDVRRDRHRHGSARDGSALGTWNCQREGRGEEPGGSSRCEKRFLTCRLSVFFSQWPPTLLLRHRPRMCARSTRPYRCTSRAWPPPVVRMPRRWVPTRPESCATCQSSRARPPALLPPRLSHRRLPLNPAASSSATRTSLSRRRPSSRPIPMCRPCTATRTATESTAKTRIASGSTARRCARRKGGGGSIACPPLTRTSPRPPQPAHCQIVGG